MSTQAFLQTIVDKGGAAAVDQYRELRKQYYSRATYDFSEDALFEIVQRVVQGKPDDAIALLRMNLEFNPQSAKTYALLGFTYTRKSDDASAMTNLEKSLELDPTNAMVRGQLEQLQEYRRAEAASMVPRGARRPFQLKGLTLANRIVIAPMTRSRSPQGVPGPDVAAYYRRRAEGEVGLIVTEGTYIDHPAAGFDPNVPHFYGEQALAGWRRVAEQVHAADGRISPSSGTSA